jgi:DNA (cytosine-5)-methyltransferase 1
MEVHRRNTPTFIEVCSGCGGLSTGFMQAGFKPIFLNEIDKTVATTLQNNHPGVSIYNCDMQELGLKEYRGHVDLLMGGVPCQSFSHAGERKGFDDPRGQLIIEFNRLINECKPKMFLVENVKGLVSHDNGYTIQSVLEMFENNGLYHVKCKILNAFDYEVPQKRERVFIVGIRTDLIKDGNIFEFPKKCKRQLVLRDVLSNVPDSPGFIYPPAKRAIMKLVPPGGCWVDLPEHLQREYLGKNILDTKGGKRGIAKRLSMDEPCLTLTTSPCQKQTERCHPIETRPLTIREYARIQTFPDTYTFHGSVNSQYKQIGNAVPVRLAYHIASTIRKYLETISPR